MTWFVVALVAVLLVAVVVISHFSQDDEDVRSRGTDPGEGRLEDLLGP